MSAADPTTPRRSRGRTVLRAGFVVAVVVALAVLLWQQRAQVAAALRGTPPAAVLASLLLGLVGAALPGLVWRDLLAGQGHPTPVLAGLRAFFVAQLGKYLPGGIWSLVAQVALARDMRIPARQAAVATFLTIALSIISAVVVAGVTLPFALPDLVPTYWWVFALVLVLIPLLHPRAVTWWSGTAFRLLRRPGTGVTLSWAVLLRSTGLLLVSWLALGAHFGLLVGGLGAGDGYRGEVWALAVGVFALAWVAGFLVVVAPAGAGVREAVLVLGLSATLPVGAVLAMAVLSRVLLVVADVVLAAAAALAARWARVPSGTGPGVRPDGRA